ITATIAPAASNPNDPGYAPHDAARKTQPSGVFQGYRFHNRCIPVSLARSKSPQVLANTECFQPRVCASPRGKSGTAAMGKDVRKSVRETTGTKAWIRFDDGFSVRACRLIDLSSTGVRIVVDAPHDVAGQFSLLLSRGAPGRRCRIKWRQGSEIGAEFIGP